MSNRKYSRKVNNNSEDKDSFHYKRLQKQKITNLTRPNVLGTTKSKVAKKNTDTARLWNDYVSQIATRKDKPPSATLFSSKDGRSASKAEISSTAGQHRPGEVGRHLSTQARCDAGSGVDLHQTVSRQTARINPELPDEGTKPASQDFLQLPPRTSKYNAAAGLVYL